MVEEKNRKRVKDPDPAHKNCVIHQENEIIESNKPLINQLNQNLT